MTWNLATTMTVVDLLIADGVGAFFSYYMISGRFDKGKGVSDLPECMDGVELARRALTAMPDLRILYTSGYTEHAMSGRSGIYRGLNLLTKPYCKA